MPGFFKEELHIIRIMRVLIGLNQSFGGDKPGESGKKEPSSALAVIGPVAVLF